MFLMFAFKDAVFSVHQKIQSRGWRSPHRLGRAPRVAWRPRVARAPRATLALGRRSRGRRESTVEDSIDSAGRAHVLSPEASMCVDRRGRTLHGRAPRNRRQASPAGSGRRTSAETHLRRRRTSRTRAPARLSGELTGRGWTDGERRDCTVSASTSTRSSASRDRAAALEPRRLFTRLRGRAKSSRFRRRDGDRQCLDAVDGRPRRTPSRGPARTRPLPGRAIDRAEQLPTRSHSARALRRRRYRERVLALLVFQFFLFL